MHYIALEFPRPSARKQPRVRMRRLVGLAMIMPAVRSVLSSDTTTYLPAFILFIQKPHN